MKYLVHFEIQIFEPIVQGKIIKSDKMEIAVKSTLSKKEEYLVFKQKILEKYPTGLIIKYRKEEIL